MTNAEFKAKILMSKSLRTPVETIVEEESTDVSSINWVTKGGV